MLTLDDVKTAMKKPARRLVDANFKNLDLSSFDFKDAELTRARFTDCALGLAEFDRARLRGAVFRACRMNSVGFRNADLTMTEFRNLSLKGAVFGGANLHKAIFDKANLRGAKFIGANLSAASLSGATYANHVKAMTEIVPREGAFVGWKKCENNVVVKLRIPADARRSNATGRKCRAEKARVLEIFGGTEGISYYDNDVVYKVGKLMKAHHWNTDRWTECAGGIHFFLTREEAEAYTFW